LNRISNIVQDIGQAMSIKINTMVYELQQEGKEITVLSLGEAFFQMPLYSFDVLPNPGLYHYSHSRGILDLRSKLATEYSKNYGVAVNPESEILITAGSKIAIHMVFQAILNPGEEAIVFEPYWVSYTEQIKLCGAVPIAVPYFETIYDVDKYITKKSKCIVINNPNNPSGKVLSDDEMKYLYELARKYNLYIISDEAYSDFTEDGKFLSAGNFDVENKHTIILNSISKNLGISGWRIGYIISNQEVIDNVLKINQHLITCPASILEYYVLQYYDKIIAITKPQIRELLKKRQQISRYMLSIGLNSLQGNSTFYFFVSISPSTLSSEEFAIKLLKEKRISTVPGIGYGKSCDKFIRLSIGTESVEKVKKSLDIIKKMINSSE